MDLDLDMLSRQGIHPVRENNLKQSQVDHPDPGPASLVNQLLTHASSKRAGGFAALTAAAADVLLFLIACVLGRGGVQ